eukprot:396392-Amphidinium_carterae.1
MEHGVGEPSCCHRGDASIRRQVFWARRPCSPCQNHATIWTCTPHWSKTPILVTTAICRPIALLARAWAILPPGFPQGLASPIPCSEYWSSTGPARLQDVM